MQHKFIQMVTALAHMDCKDSCTRMLFSDISLVLNTIIPQQVVQKPNHFGLHVSLSNWVLDFFSGSPQSVQVGCNSSRTITLNSEAPHGRLLSSLLSTAKWQICCNLQHLPHHKISGRKDGGGRHLKYYNCLFFSLNINCNIKMNTLPWQQISNKEKEKIGTKKQNKKKRVLVICN